MLFAIYDRNSVGFAMLFAIFNHTALFLVDLLCTACFQFFSNLTERKDCIRLIQGQVVIFSPLQDLMQSSWNQPTANVLLHKGKNCHAERLLQPNQSHSIAIKCARIFVANFKFVSNVLKIACGLAADSDRVHLADNRFPMMRLQSF